MMSGEERRKKLCPRQRITTENLAMLSSLARPPTTCSIMKIEKKSETRNQSAAAVDCSTQIAMFLRCSRDVFLQFLSTFFSLSVLFVRSLFTPLSTGVEYQKLSCLSFQFMRLEKKKFSFHCKSSSGFLCASCARSCQKSEPRNKRDERDG